MALKDHKDKIIRMRLSGMKCEDGHYFGVTRGAISNVLVRWGYGTSANSTGINAIRREKEKVTVLYAAGWTQGEIAGRYGTRHSKTISQILRREHSVERRAGELERFVPGQKYGKLVFERVVHGKARMLLFRHSCGWRETFTEFQWRELKA